MTLEHLLVGLLSALLVLVGFAMRVFSGLRQSIEGLAKAVGNLSESIVSLDTWRHEHDKRDDERFHHHDRRLSVLEGRRNGD